MPNVQFAPYYLAADRGYYSDAGIDITIKDGANAGLLEQLGSGSIDFGLTGGDALTPARAKGIPVTYVMAQFQKYPVGALAITGTNPSLTAPADLKGRNVGVSAPNGSTYIGLLALLQAAKLTLNDIHLISIGFTEVEALQQKRVDAAMTFLTNEPVQVRALGLQIQTLAVADYANLVSTGLATGEKNLTGRADLVQRFVAASLRGLRATQQEPDAAFAAALKRMPEVAADAKQTQIQRDVLTSTLAFEQPPSGHPLGWSDPAAWQAMQDLLKSTGLIDKTVDPALLYTNQFAEAAG
jgi:NitT/TauT family transport system substrate-binding protein